MRAIEWFAKHRVAANLAGLTILVAGLLAIPDLRYEVFPEVEPEIISIAVEYPGAAPEEVESGVCIPLERALQAVPDVERMTCRAREGLGTLTLELRPTADTSRILDEAKSRVDGIGSLPDDARRPVVSNPLIRRHVINVALSGEIGERPLKALAERVREEIEALPEVSYAEVSSVRPYEIAIEVSEAMLRRHELSLDDIAREVRESSRDIPGGTLRTAAGQIRLRTIGQAYSEDEFERIAIRSRADGSMLRLGDVATVVDGFAEVDREARFDGKPTALVQVYRVGDESALEISRAVRAYIEDAAPSMPAAVRLVPWQDDARILSGRLELLIRSAWSGFALVLVALGLFLSPRLAFWVGVGVPFSFLGALWVMNVADVSINVVSLFGFILVLGILVDDAIVVGENVYAEHENGKSPLQAAISGAQAVAIPVTYGVLTSVVAFIPLLIIPGAAGKIWRQIPVVVIAALLFSLAKSYFILPTHLARSCSRPERQGGLVASLRRTSSSALALLVERAYQPLLGAVLRRRYLTVATALAVLMASFGLIAGNWIRFVFFPPIEGDRVVASLTLPVGTSFETLRRAVGSLETTARQIERELLGEDEEALFEHILASAGEQPFLRDQSSTAGASNVGQVEIALTSPEQRRVTADQVARAWRARAQPIPGVEELDFSASLYSVGAPVDVQLRAGDSAQLREASSFLRDQLVGLAGVYDVTESVRDSQSEIELRLKPPAASLGVGMSELGRQVRQSFYGEEIQRIQRVREEVPVFVRYPAAERRSLADLENVRIRTPDGIGIPITAVADVSITQAPSEIVREESQRAARVRAQVDLAVTTPDSVYGELRARILPQLQRFHPQVSYSFQGEERERQQSLAGLGKNYAQALFAIFCMLALPLRSYAQPLLIMCAIPFGAVGAIAGHLVMGLDLSFSSLIGMVALSGVVVNDSLVLVDWTNRLRRQGQPATEALRQAGTARFRAVFLTSLTTALGLAPLLLERSVQAQFLIPMATSLAFGIVLATAVTLVVVPAGYLILCDLKTRLGTETRASPAIRQAA